MSSENVSSIPEKENEGENDITKLVPWNSSDYPVTINSIRYNQDHSLLTLSTSRGYKIFLSNNLKQVNEETDIVRELGSLSIAMNYFKSSLVFFICSKENPNFSTDELIVFDDAEQRKISSFKLKNNSSSIKEEILNFCISRNEIFIITCNKIIILELLSFQVIKEIENINCNQKLISYNFYDFIAYTKLNEEKKINVTFFNNKNHKASYIFNRVVKSTFDQIQCLQISPTGNIVALVSPYGNKIHIYYTNSSRLKECLFIGNFGNNIDKIIFSIKKENYLLLVKNFWINKNKNEKNKEKKKKFVVYKLEKNFEENPKCVCCKYNDNGEKIEKNDDKDKKNKNNDGGFFGFFRKNSKNLDVKDEHTSGEIKGKDLLFIEFNGDKNKSWSSINKEGYYFKYLINKKKQNTILPQVTVKWA